MSRRVAKDIPAKVHLSHMGGPLCKTLSGWYVPMRLTERLGQVTCERCESRLMALAKRAGKLRLKKEGGSPPDHSGTNDRTRPLNVVSLSGNVGEGSGVP